MPEKSYVVRSRRYFDKDGPVEKKVQKKANLIVFEGAIDQALLQQILAHFINKYRKAGHEVVTANAPMMPSAMQTQMGNPVKFLRTMCRLTGEWYNEKIQPALDNGKLVLLDYYFHRYLATAMVMEMQMAQHKLQQKMDALEQQGRPIPKELPPLEVSTQLIDTLKKEFTDAIPVPDVLFGCFDGSDMQAMFVKKAFNELFSVEPYVYPANTFYGLESVIKEMEIRLSDYVIGGKQ